MGTIQKDWSGKACGGDEAKDRVTSMKERKCKICGKWFAVIPAGGSYISCCVQHPPGECCHMGDREVVEPFWGKDTMEIMRIANGL